MSDVTNFNMQITRTVDLIAAEINSIKEQTRKMVLYNSIEIGRRLIEAKSMVSHGEWGNWLKESVDYSQSTANNLMKIFNEYGADQLTLLGDNSKSQALGNLSYTQAIALLGIPSEDRENFIKENNVEDMSTRELQNAIKETQKLKDELKAKDEEGKKKDERLNKLKQDNEKMKIKLQEVDTKQNEALTNKEVEIENLKIEIKSLEKKAEETSTVEESGEVESVRNELDKKSEELRVAIETIEELKKKAEEKPIEINAEIPEEVEKELQELREKVSQAAKKEADKHNDSTVKFKVYFEVLVKGFNDLLKSLNEIEEEELKEKYKGAVLRLMNDMGQKL
jgi:DNA repair exonuclease SbcCD ATPase subunit